MDSGRTSSRRGRSLSAAETRGRNNEELRRRFRAGFHFASAVSVSHVTGPTPPSPDPPDYRGFVADVALHHVLVRLALHGYGALADAAADDRSAAAAVRAALRRVGRRRLAGSHRAGERRQTWRKGARFGLHVQLIIVRNRGFFSQVDARDTDAVEKKQTRQRRTSSGQQWNSTQGVTCPSADTAKQLYRLS